LKSRSGSPLRQQEDIMTKGIQWGAPAAALVLSFALAPGAEAATAAWTSSAWLTEEASEARDVLDAGVPPEGKTTWGSSVKFSSAGVLSVSAYDLGVPMTLMDKLQSLSFSVSNATSILGTHIGDGVLALDIKGPGEYFVAFTAVPSQTSKFKLPLVSWSLSFEPNATTVPLPASVWLLLGGLVWATGMQRKRAKLAPRDDSPRWKSQDALPAH
jgi:hypothetical protein